MQLNKRKGFLFALILAFFSVNVFAATTDLSARFLDKANESYENGNTDEAYKYVNQALAVAKDEDSKANVLYFAQTVYSQKLQELQKNFDTFAGNSGRGTQIKSAQQYGKFHNASLSIFELFF